ncbi:hypothetical protein GUJ93_ZPchr0013g33866 [Zizania palustris]|uniref:Endonuclease/exonuclease/phosphatase domain-containing protein n=1 Tax=Zizania palustris TaxID=103762 RepID=A0A8J5WWF8_ZIZPA|nr:hypothetical protein GUJ93_ZPchr0013g33866 [Zizania palustris]
MASTVKRVLRRFLDGLRSLLPRCSKAPRVVVTHRSAGGKERSATPAAGPAATVTIRVATFNAAMFSMAPAVPPPPPPRAHDEVGCSWRSSPASGSALARRPKKGILKARCPAPASPAGNRRRRVSINLPDDATTSQRSGTHPMTMPSTINGGGGGSWKGKSVAGAVCEKQQRRSVAEVLREVGADMVAMHNVRADEERGMRPLSELAEVLGMRYVFAESWAPEYGNAVLSRWPIKRWKAHRLADHSDFRNVLRATIDVPGAGEVNFHCTHLDHLDESLRMKQVNSILRYADGHHILAGGLNALDVTDYSADRWAGIAKYYEEIGKPAPKAEVMRHLKAKHYVDAKDFAGEGGEAVVVVAKGQDVQGTCKYGTRVDYILASSTTSPNSPYKFVPGSYAVVSSKGTSDHHIVKADVTVAAADADGGGGRCRRRRVVRMTSTNGPVKGIWASSAR